MIDSQPVHVTVSLPDDPDVLQKLGIHVSIDLLVNGQESHVGMSSEDAIGLGFDLIDAAYRAKGADMMYKLTQFMAEKHPESASSLKQYIRAIAEEEVEGEPDNPGDVGLSFFGAVGARTA